MNRFTPLKRNLENCGWQVTNIDVPSEAWWALEIWELKSIWRPHGQKLHLSLILDPMRSSDPNKPKDTDVWAVALGNKVPTGFNCENVEFEIGIKRKFAERTLEVIEVANQLREKWCQESQ